jgi:hypothetical protein
MGINGLLTDVRWEWTGTEITEDLLAGATILPVLDPESITVGEFVWIAGTGPYEIIEADIEGALFTIAPGLALDVDAGTEVANDVGGQPGRAWVCEVVLADADRPIEVPLTIHDLAVMPEGIYDPPVTIVLSDDLERVEDLPGSLPVVDGAYIPDLPPPGEAGGNNIFYQPASPWPDGEAGHRDNELWYDTDDNNKPYLWDTEYQIWVDASDPRVDVLDDPGQLVVGDVTLDQMQSTVTNNYETSQSAQSLASTADGRISMSDYDPTPEDVLYYATDSSGALIRSTSFKIATTQLTSGVVTLTLDPTGGPVTCDAGDWIVITGCGSPYDGDWQLESHVPEDPQDDPLPPIPATITYRVASPDQPLVVLDPLGTGYNTLLQQRVPGSIWYTRTRNRINLCDNPSFEVDLANWTFIETTAVRLDPVPGPDDPTNKQSPIAGQYVVELTNSGVAGDHRAQWLGGTLGMEVTEGESFASTCFAIPVSGVNTNCYASLRFYDAADVQVGPVITGLLTDLVVDDWRELRVAGIVPVGATKMGAINLHNPNPGAVWRIDGALVEQGEYTGRYFDGSVYDGRWLGTPDQSSSELIGGKIVSVYELYNGSWMRLDFTGTTTYDANASDLTTGILPPARIGANSIKIEKRFTNSVRVSDTVTAGQFVNIWSNNGLFFVRPAIANEVGKEAHGFVLVTGAPGAAVPVYTEGYNPLCSGLQPGPQFLSPTVAGLASNVVPQKVGRIVQEVGIASDATTLQFNPQRPVLLT